MGDSYSKSRIMWDLMLTFIRLGSASERSEDWGFVSRNDMEQQLRILINKLELQEVIKDTGMPQEGWSNTIDIEYKPRYTVTVSDSYTISYDEYRYSDDESNRCELQELITLDLHHQSHQSGVDQEVFDLDSS